MPTQVTVARAGEGLLAHFPDVVRTAAGRLLATYREGAGHVRSDGRIRLVESADDGRSWGVPWTAVDGPHDDRDPKLAVLADGTVLLSYFVIDWSTRPHTLLGTFVRRSTDGGRTWGDESAAGPPWCASHGAAVQLADGKVLLPLYGRPPGERRERAVVLHEDGAVVDLAVRDDADFQEPTLTVLDGQVVALIRAAEGPAWIARSADGGHTWSTPGRTDLPASSHHALALSTGEVLVTYGDLGRPNRPTTGRLVRRPGESWDGHGDVPLYDSGHPDQANPSSVELAPGEFLTLGFDVPAAAVVGVFTSAGDYPARERVSPGS